MKKILVAVTGMSPQIVTETLFVLAVRQEWIPDEIHVLTTRLGAVRLQDTLLGESGHFVRFCQEYGMPHIAFSAAHIHIIEDDQGRELDDIRTPGQNNLAADMIVRFIHQLCAREDSVLHVSIAGGRKSMGFCRIPSVSVKSFVRPLHGFARCFRCGWCFVLRRRIRIRNWWE